MLWIEKENKRKFISGKKTGILVKYDDSLCIEDKRECDLIINFLVSNYYFPFRLTIWFTDDVKYKSFADGHSYYASFYKGEIINNRFHYPKIAIAAKTNKYKSIYDISFSVFHEITHYYQWFFYEDEDRTDRSLEIEANRYAYYIRDLYNEFRENNV